MKFGQFIEYKIRNIFLKNHTQNVAEKPFPDPFLKNQNRAYLWINSLKFSTVEEYRNILKLRCRSLAFTSNEAFFKKRSRTGIPASFSV